MLTQRTSGIFLHVSSLPSPFGIGDMGPAAYAYVDWLVRAKQSLWQVLPVNPASAVRHYSPYEATSAFAGDPLLISPQLLCDCGLLAGKDLKLEKSLSDDRVAFAEVVSAKTALFNKAYEAFKSQPEPESFRLFCSEHSFWLDDYAVFSAHSASVPNMSWWEWPVALRDRKELKLDEVRDEAEDVIRKEKFLQYLFFGQWFRLKCYANERGIAIVGDIPFYVGRDCADVWAHPDVFKLGDDKKPKAVAGVPPDCFSDTGQLWGNPVYDWDQLQKANYRWWIQRLRHNLAMFDVVRIDHFRGFAANWEIPADSKTAAVGRWSPGPGRRFFGEVFRHFPFAPIFAENLGIVTADVGELIREFNLSGMEVLLFAFDGDASNPYLPHNHVPDAVLYTGTHDNNTIRGWFDDEAGHAQKEKLFAYLGHEVSSQYVHLELIRMAMKSVSKVVIIPMQDVLGLGSAARMNRPATLVGNWEWRMRHDQAAQAPDRLIAEFVRIYGRT
jgi:4-alpha-glucanotransferase